MTSPASTSRPGPTRRSSARSPTARSSSAPSARRHRGRDPRRRAAQARHRALPDPGLRRRQRHRHAEPARGGGGGRPRPLRLHLDHLADDLASHPRRKGGRRHSRGLARRGLRAAGAAQHLRSDQARRRATVPPRTTASTACRCIVLRTGRFFPEEDDTDRDLVRPQQQGQRVPQSPADRRGLPPRRMSRRWRRRRGIGFGTLHRLRAAALRRGRCGGADRGRAGGRSPATSRRRRSFTRAPAGGCPTVSTGSTIRRGRSASSASAAEPISPRSSPRSPTGPSHPLPTTHSLGSGGRS